MKYLALLAAALIVHLVLSIIYGIIVGLLLHRWIAGAPHPAASVSAMRARNILHGGETCPATPTNRRLLLRLTAVDGRKILESAFDYGTLQHNTLRIRDRPRPLRN